MSRVQATLHNRLFFARPVLVVPEVKKKLFSGIAQNPFGGLGGTPGETPGVRGTRFWAETDPHGPSRGHAKHGQNRRKCRKYDVRGVISGGFRGELERAGSWGRAIPHFEANEPI